MLATMTPTLAPHWRPTTEGELKGALTDGAFTESSRREAKRQLRSPKDQAKDMASFAIDGGLIVVGLDEDKDAGTFSLAPIPFEDQLCESVEQRALGLCDPPLAVAVDWLESDDRPGHGYLLVDIPASPLAPHQVDGAYYGRGDKTKRRLSDGDVTRLIRARDTALDTVRRVLRERVSADPFPQGTLVHHHVVAVPSRRIPDMFRQWTSADNPQPLLYDLVRNRVSRATRQRASHGCHAAPAMDSLHFRYRTAGGVALGTARPHESEERHDLRLVLRERGEVYLFCGRASDSRPSLQRQQVFDGAVAFRVRAFLDLVRALAEDTGYGGSWDVGVALTNMQGVKRFTNEWEFGSTAIYDEDAYEQVTQVSRVELVRPGSATDRLVGELMRSLESPYAHLELLSDD